MYSIPEHCLAKIFNFVTLAGGPSKRCSSLKDKYDNVEFECIKHEENLSGSAVLVYKSHDGESRLKNLTWCLREKDDNVSLLAYNNFEGTEKTVFMTT